jgi:hypothetical protein
MPGKTFPTVAHPPGNILMGGRSQGKLGMMCDGDFPQVLILPKIY